MPHIPSEPEVLMTDVFLFLVIFTAEMTAIIYYFSNGRHREPVLFLLGIFGVSSSILLFVARASVPIGFHLVNNTVNYRYQYNPYSRIYLSTLALGVMMMILYALNLVTRTSRRGLVWRRRR